MKFQKKSFIIVFGVALFSLLGVGGCIARLAPSSHVTIDINQVLDKKNIMPLVIIGSGPAGLSAAVYGVWGNVPTLVIHGPKPGGLLMETSYVENWPGQKSILGADIIKGLQSQVKGIAAHAASGTVNKIQFLEDTITEINFDRWPYIIKTDLGTEIYAMAIIIATGASPKLLKVPGEQEYWSRGVTSCAVCDAPFFKGKDVVVVGAGDSAAEEAMQLAQYAKTVTILGRKEKMRAAPTMQARLKDYPTISIVYNVEVNRIVGNEAGVTGVELYNNKTQETQVMATDGVFLAIGHTPNSSLFASKLAIDSDGYIKVKGRTQESSVVGVFVAGDVQDRKYKQAGTAAGDGIKAALDAREFLSHSGFTPAILERIKNQLYKTPVTAGAVPHLDAAEHQAVIEKSEGYVGVVYHAVADNAGEGQEQPLLPDEELASVAQDFDDQIQFVRVDVQDNEQLARKAFVDDEACLVVYHKGRVVGRYQGQMTTHELCEFVKNIIEVDQQPAAAIIA